MKRLIILAVTIIATAGSSASAHHSHPYFYDQCKSITVEGSVESVQWKNPHTLIVVSWTTERRTRSIGPG